MSRPAKHKILLEKSKEAVLAAIGQYNHPRNPYREETFCILMTNAWELLLKAKMVKESNGRLNSIWVIDNQAKRKDGKPFAKPKYKTNKSGNQITLGLTALIGSEQDFDEPLKKQLKILAEIRDDAVHFVLSDALKKSILSVASATLKSYIIILQEKFDDRIDEQLYLLPLALNMPKHFSGTVNQNEEKNLLNYIANQHESVKNKSKHQICIDIDIKFSRSKDGGILVESSKDGLPVMMDSEEIFQNKYPWTYKDGLIPKLKEFSNFKQDKQFHRVKKTLEKNKQYCDIRYLDLNKKSGSKMKFYSPNILKEFKNKLNLKK